MKFQDIIVGDFYQVINNSRITFERLDGGNKTLHEGTVLQCVFKMKRDRNSWQSYSMTEMIETDSPTHRWRIYNHTGLVPYTPGEDMDGDRTKEREYLENKIPQWIKEQERWQGEVDKLGKQIDEARIRLANLQKYESGTEALAAHLQSKLGKELNAIELTKLIQEAGIKVN